MSAKALEFSIADTPIKFFVALDMYMTRFIVLLENKRTDLCVLENILKVFKQRQMK